MPRAILLVCAAAAACIVGGAAAADAHAAVIGVTTDDDAVSGDGDCSLREAIQAANADTAVDACPAGDGADLILLGPRTHRLTIPGAWEDAAASGDLDVTSEITLRGAGTARTIIDGGRLDRVLHVLSSGALTIERLTVTGGLTPPNDRFEMTDLGGADPPLYRRTGGGGVLADGPLTVRHCAIEANGTGPGTMVMAQVPGGVVPVATPAGFGGGILSRAALDVRDSTIAHNLGGDGATGESPLASVGLGGMGGGVAVFAGSASIVRTTIAHNQTGASDSDTQSEGTFAGGGGLFLFTLFSGGPALVLEDSTVVHNRAMGAEGESQAGGGILALGEMTISRTTIAFNVATSGGGVASSFGGDAFPVPVRGSLLAGNEATTSPDCHAVTDQGGNVFGTGCDGASATVGFELASLGELGDHGGPTQTLPLLVGSLAIDAGGTCDAPDQRGAPRPVGDACDAGAFEWSRCGDGVTDDGETCDAGGDSASCTFTCTASACGDGYTNVAAGEACDDGDANDDDTPGACRTSCQLEACGDGAVDPTERCDDAGESATCDADCTSVVCGDGLTNQAAGESCDDGGDNSATEPDACRPGCALAGCGDGVVDSGEDCDEGDANGQDPADTCRSDCSLPRCGDGVVVGDEACDDGEANAETADACRTSCTLPACGDGIVDSGEACDPPEGLFATLPDGCRPGCVAASCGDGAIDTGEGCDDGNGEPGDGCSACVVDAGWRCSYDAAVGSVCERVPATGDGDTIGGDGDTTGGADTGTSGKSSGGCAGSSTPSAPALTSLLLVLAGLTRRRRRLGERF